MGAEISIHAPREGGDGNSVRSTVTTCISIHAPREGGDRAEEEARRNREVFQSTPPARGATLTFWAISSVVWISIHAPREGGDLAVDDVSHEMNGFQSTPPARGATSLLLPARYRPINFNPRPPRGGRRAFSLVSYRGYLISIHAPREGGDL